MCVHMLCNTVCYLYDRHHWHSFRDHLAVRSLQHTHGSSADIGGREALYSKLHRR